MKQELKSGCLSNTVLKIFKDKYLDIDNEYNLF